MTDLSHPLDLINLVHAKRGEPPAQPANTYEPTRAIADDKEKKPFESIPPSSDSHEIDIKYDFNRPPEPNYESPLDNIVDIGTKTAHFAGHELNLQDNEIQIIIGVLVEATTRQLDEEAARVRNLYGAMQPQRQPEVAMQTGGQRKPEILLEVPRNRKAKSKKATRKRAKRDMPSLFDSSYPNRQENL